METQNNNISDTQFIFNILEEILNEREKNLIQYLENGMSKQELELHFDNIFYNLKNPTYITTLIKMKMLADGRKIN